MLHAADPPLFVTLMEERLTVAGRATVVHLQHGVSAVCEPLRRGVVSPRVTRPGASVHQEHHRGRFGGIGASEVRHELQAVARRNPNVFHVCELVVKKRLLAYEERRSLLGGPIVHQIFGRAIVAAKAHHPRGVVTVLAHHAHLRALGRLFIEQVVVSLKLVVEERSVAPCIVEADGLNLLRFLIDHNTAHVTFLALGHHFKGVACGEVNLEQRSRLAANRAQHVSRPWGAEVNHTALLAVGEGHQLAPLRVGRITHANRLA
mmetsp:Transcript_8707/g.18499  ORF Transcript_8707/g.18499 Transcript_8707/m.18499 type:complete len:262 (+) Transcript_8707:678-1463(+)